MTERELVRSAVRSHIVWLSRGATVRHREPNARWVVREQDASLLFPRLEEDDAGRVIDAFLAAARAGEVKTAACWSTLPARPPQLGEQLLARGFETGWQPHWMAIEALPAARRPDGITIEVQARGTVAWRATATRDGAFAGVASAVVRDDGAGVFDVYTPDAERRHGIGWATTQAALEPAFAAGATHATVNATALGERLYRAMGFRSLGWGQTWWIHQPRLHGYA